MLKCAVSHIWLSVRLLNGYNIWLMAAIRYSDGGVQQCNLKYELGMYFLKRWFLLFSHFCTSQFRWSCILIVVALILWDSLKNVRSN